MTLEVRLHDPLLVHRGQIVRGQVILGEQELRVAPTLDRGANVLEGVLQIKLHTLLGRHLLGVAAEEEQDHHQDEGHQHQAGEDPQHAHQNCVRTRLGDISDKNSRTPRLKVG